VRWDFGMIKLFISHSTKDISLAKFLVHLFDFYSIKTRCSFSDLEIDSDFEQNNDKALLTSDTLLVLITENARSSSWITEDISIFRKFKPHAEIIPLLFEKMNLNEDFPGSDQFQFIDFTQDLTSGFKELFTKFGMKFLDPGERRRGYDRRNGVDRRTTADRRSKNVTLRLYKTFCKMYSEISQNNEDTFIDIDDPHDFEIFLESVKVGARKFMCLDESGNLYNTNDAINYCLNQICLSLHNAATNNEIKHIKAKELTFILAKEMTNNYIIRWKDRRKATERRSGCDRREICETLTPVWSLN